MSRFRWQTVVALACLLFASAALAINVSCEFSLRDGKTQYRSGEPIELILSYSADARRYRLTNEALSRRLRFFAAP